MFCYGDFKHSRGGVFGLKLNQRGRIYSISFISLDIWHDPKGLKQQANQTPEEDKKEQNWPDSKHNYSGGSIPAPPVKTKNIYGLQTGCWAWTVVTHQRKGDYAFHPQHPQFSRSRRPHSQSSTCYIYQLQKPEGF